MGVEFAATHLSFSPAVLADPLIILALLFLVALIAGFVDAIAGGGGLLSIPALLWAGMTPVQALATNKLQASFGSLTATLNYARNGLIPWRELRLAVVMTFIGSACGALLVQQLPTALLERFIPVLLILLALYFLLTRQTEQPPRQPRLSALIFGMLAGSAIGFYDGFFGPGTGSFFTLAFVTLLGYSLVQAVGSTKLLNFTSNFAALLVFAFSGQIVWLTGLVMAAGQIIGSYAGSHVTMKHGARLIRPVIVVVTLLLALKLLLD
jgi:uncharacterized membrane protein YfcA